MCHKQCALNHDAIELAPIVSSFINKPTTVELCISPVYRRLAVAKFLKSTPQCRNCSRDPDHAPYIIKQWNVKHDSLHPATGWSVPSAAGIQITTTLAMYTPTLILELQWSTLLHSCIVLYAIIWPRSSDMLLSVRTIVSTLLIVQRLTVPRLYVRTPIIEIEFSTHAVQHTLITQISIQTAGFAIRRHRSVFLSC